MLRQLGPDNQQLQAAQQNIAAVQDDIERQEIGVLPPFEGGGQVGADTVDGPLDLGSGAFDDVYMEDAPYDRRYYS